MDFVVSKSVREGDKILALIKKDDAWIAISKKDNRESVVFNEEQFYIVKEEYLTERIPKLKGKLEQPDETIINVDYDTGEVNFNKKHFHFGIPTHSARATRQANTEFSFSRWIQYNKTNYYKSLFWMIAFLILGKLFGWFFYCLLPIPAVLRYLIDSKQRDMYKSGALLPGVVIDEQKGHIAVLTDLSLGVGKYPLLKIERVVLPEPKKRINAKLAIAGTYANMENYPHWNFFEPIVLLCGMKYPEKHDEKIKQIPPNEWLKLKLEINKMNAPISPGYYAINVEQSEWRNIDLEKVKWMDTSI